MFDIGIQELIVIFLVALIVLGPKRLPELGRTLGKFMLEIRKGIGEVKFQMESEFREIEKDTAVTSKEHTGNAMHAGGKEQSEDSGKRGKEG